LVEEAIELAQSWDTISPKQILGLAESDKTWARCLALGTYWEPDFLLLRIDSVGSVRLLAGVVCFPSAWSLGEKIGRPIEAIHGVVPGLNPAIGSQIQSFLTKLKPGVAWLRSNWGLSRSPELNQHPFRRLPRLDPAVRLEEIWLRLEHQALVALPKNNGVLFGIRIAMQPLSEIANDRVVAPRLARSLKSMPQEVAEYKGLAGARQRLVALLEV
jgi:hypothetical protein